MLLRPHPFNLLMAIQRNGKAVNALSGYYACISRELLLMPLGMYTHTHTPMFVDETISRNQARVAHVPGLKTYLNTITTALTMLYFHSNKLNAAAFVHQRISKIPTKSRFHLIASLPAGLPTGTNLEPIPLNKKLAFKLAENKHYFCQHKPLLF